MFVVIGLFVLMTDCYELQTLDTIDTYEKLTVAYHNFTTLIIDIVLLQYYHQNRRRFSPFAQYSVVL